MDRQCRFWLRSLATAGLWSALGNVRPSLQATGCPRRAGWRCDVRRRRGGLELLPSESGDYLESLASDSIGVDLGSSTGLSPFFWASAWVGVATPRSVGVDFGPSPGFRPSFWPLGILGASRQRRQKALMWDGCSVRAAFLLPERRPGDVGVSRSWLPGWEWGRKPADGSHPPASAWWSLGSVATPADGRP